MVCPRCHEEKGTLAAIGALALLTMIHKDVGDVLNEAVLRLRVDPDNWYVHTLITRLSETTPRQLEAVSAGSLLYAALRYVEGLGLLWRQRWAAYVTVIATAAFIPLDVFELTRRVSWPKLVVIAMNVAVVWYVVARLRIGWTSRPDEIPAPRARSHGPPQCAWRRSAHNHVGCSFDGVRWDARDQSGTQTRDRSAYWSKRY